MYKKFKLNRTKIEGAISCQSEGGQVQSGRLETHPRHDVWPSDENTLLIVELSDYSQFFLKNANVYNINKVAKLDRG